jgi:hypothetical protein
MTPQRLANDVPMIREEVPMIRSRKWLIYGVVLLALLALAGIEVMAKAFWHDAPAAKMDDPASTARGGEEDYVEGLARLGILQFSGSTAARIPSAATVQTAGQSRNPL